MPSKAKSKKKSKKKASRQDTPAYVERLKKFVRQNRANKVTVASSAIEKYGPQPVLIAKELYYRGLSLPEVSEATEISAKDLNALVYSTGGWKDTRSAFFRETWKHIENAALEDVQQVVGMTTEFIKRNLERYMTQDIEVGIKELKLLSDITANFDRFARLDLGKPTNHVLQQVQGQSLNELLQQTREALVKIQKSDPMAGELFESGRSEQIESTESITAATETGDSDPFRLN
jgi:hypothetical protein